jgi:hypothetical protein
MELRRALLPLVMLSLLCVRAEAARHILEAGYTGSSRSTSIKRSLIVDTPKLERLIRNSKYRGTPAELVKQLLREKDLVSIFDLILIGLRCSFSHSHRRAPSTLDQKSCKQACHLVSV